MQKVLLFFGVGMLLMLTTKSMENTTIYNLNESSITSAYQAARCSIAWTLKRNSQLNIFKGPSCTTQKSVDELKICCDDIRDLASISKDTAEFQEKSKELASSSYCAHALYKNFLEALHQKLSPDSFPIRHKRSFSDTRAQKS